MSWRVQADDPIEKCEEAKYVWVMFKKDVPFKEWREINFPELCEVFVSWIDNKKKIKVLGAPLWPGEPTWTNPSANQSSLISPNDISHWQLIPTPDIPFTMTKEQP